MRSLTIIAIIIAVFLLFGSYFGFGSFISWFGTYRIECSEISPKVFKCESPMNAYEGGTEDICLIFGGSAINVYDGHQALVSVTGTLTKTQVQGQPTSSFSKAFNCASLPICCTTIDTPGDAIYDAHFNSMDILVDAQLPAIKASPVSDTPSSEVLSSLKSFLVRVWESILNFLHRIGA